MDVTKEARRPSPQYLFNPSGEKPSPLEPDLLAWLVEQLCSDTRVHPERTMSCGYITNQSVYELPAVFDALTTAQSEAAELRKEVERLQMERDFLLARAGAAGSCNFGSGRWTGMSSNALVAVAFGHEDDFLPSDASDLAACYRTMQRLPKHLLSEAVWQQLEAGERYVASKYDIAWAKENAGWPDNPRAALKETQP